MTGAGGQRLFAAGKTVFLLDTATAAATIRRDDPDVIGRVTAIALVPTGPTGRPEPGLHAPAFCIPSASPVKDDAWKLLTFLSSFEDSLRGAVEGTAAEPARHSVIAAAAYAATYDGGFQAVIRDTRAHARINRPLIPFGFQLGEIVGAAVAAAIAGELTASEALRDAQRTIDAMVWSASATDPARHA
jgi:ABC-type glycerol-3-phosphate transport system substrate-binding protein